jgi:FtsH-binding integral membrane protein
MQLPPDGGMLYTETNLNHSFPEPLNTITSGFFFILALYWIFQLKGFSRQYIFLSLASWILLIGSTGGTLYHGLRQYPVFIMMDWLPISILCLLASVYFWIKFSGKWFVGVLMLIVFICVELLIRKTMFNNDRQLGISLNYAAMVLMILLPLVLLLIKMKGHNWRFIVAALLSFGIALFFRIADSWNLLLVGTHFLWHTFGVIATALMFVFLKRIATDQLVKVAA